MTVSPQIPSYIGDVWLVLSLACLIVIVMMHLFDSIKREQVLGRMKSHVYGIGEERQREFKLSLFLQDLGLHLKFLIPGNAKEREEAEKRLCYAGYRHTSALAIYYLIRMIGMVVIPSVVYVSGKVFGFGTDLKILSYTLVALGVGLIGPSYILDRKVAKRQLTLRNALPDALDLLVVCAESGLGLNAAMVRVVKELHRIHPELAGELRKVNSEIHGGMDRETALGNMVNRTGIDELRALVLVINQTLRLGTSIAETLRVYSDEYRDSRMQAAEAKAAEISTKMIFPLVFCFLPCFFIVSVGPSAIKLMGTMG